MQVVVFCKKYFEKGKKELIFSTILQKEYASVDNVAAEFTILQALQQFRISAEPSCSKFVRSTVWAALVTDIDIPPSLWQVTFGEDLYPNIDLERPER